MTLLNQSRVAFESAVAQAIEAFPANSLARRIEAAEFGFPEYHRLLNTIFHQTFRAPQSFALAGAMMPSHHLTARNYLIRHAAEEHTHWEWALNDLEKTGYAGPDPREEVPSPACAAYIGFNYFIALQHPIARLSIAAVLEGLGAAYSKRYALLVAKQLELKPNQMMFFLGHSDTDVEHTQEIHKVVSELNLSAIEWQWMACAATTAGQLYTQMYEEAGR